MLKNADYVKNYIQIFLYTCAVTSQYCFETFGGTYL
jgi:hypothetical protein